MTSIAVVEGVIDKFSCNDVIKHDIKYQSNLRCNVVCDMRCDICNGLDTFNLAV